ncbi:unnamed protein product [Pylaiella littoralis]
MKTFVPLASLVLLSQTTPAAVAAAGREEMNIGSSRRGSRVAGSRAMHPALTWTSKADSSNSRRSSGSSSGSSSSAAAAAAASRGDAKGAGRAGGAAEGRGAGLESGAAAKASDRSTYQGAGGRGGQGGRDVTADRDSASSTAGRDVSGKNGAGLGSGGGGGGGRGDGRGSVAAAGSRSGVGGHSGGGGGGSGGGAVQGRIDRLRSALQQKQVGDPATITTTTNNNNNNRAATPTTTTSAPGGRGYATGSSSSSSSNNNNNDPRSFSKSEGVPADVGRVGGGGGYSNVEAERGTTSSPEPSPGEDHQLWEDFWGGRGVQGEVEGGGDSGATGEVFDVSDGGGGRWEEAEEEEDEEAEKARAAAAAARVKNEIALLKEIEANDQRGMSRPGEDVLPPLSQHTRSVVTEAMPARFIDEVGAHIATALAMAAVKGLISAVVNLRGHTKTEKVAFADVVGCDEAKDEVKQIVDFLVDPSAYDSLGAARPKGILLVGPPGTGKTLIAKACAGEAGVPFLYACGSDFNGVYVGMGVAAVKKLFAKARKHKKSIIYIDEIDYLGRARSSGTRDTSGATQDREATLNQLLSEMDGFEARDGIVVMASTNRKEILDDALLRSGRFDMQVDVERPDRKGREQLFSKYIAPLKLLDEDGRGQDVDNNNNNNNNRPGGGGRSRVGRGGRPFGGAAAAMAAEKEKQAAIKKQELRADIAKELADMTPYMTGADVANVCATAGRIAARTGSDSVVLEHFSAAVDRVQHEYGDPQLEVPQQDKERTAIHEAGHAVAAWMLPWCDEVVKVSIVWRGNALGFSQTAMVERQSQMREMVLDSVCMTLAGRAAEEVVCGTISGGASSDLRVASRQLYAAITEVGFGSTTGLLSPGNRQLSEKVMADVDQEVQTLLAQQYRRALSLVRTYRDEIDSLSAALLEQSVVHKADLRRILGEKATVESEEAAAAEAFAAALLKSNEAAEAEAEVEVEVEVEVEDAKATRQAASGGRAAASGGEGNEKEKEQEREADYVIRNPAPAEA